MRDYLKKRYKEEYRDFFKEKNKKWAKKIGALNLYPFWLLYNVYESYFHTEDICCAYDLKGFKLTTKEYSPGEIYRIWKKTLKHDANKVLKNLVSFVSEDDPKRKNMEKALEEFEKVQRDTILKSEVVEKNDGKAIYILRRLFKAYITNSHQLPDIGLKFILDSIQETDIWNGLIEGEKDTVKEILYKLRKTMTDINKAEKRIKEILDTDFLENDEIESERLKEGTSNEIKAALENIDQLFVFLRKLKNEKSGIQQCLYSEKDEDRAKLKCLLRQFRAVLDNPVLNKIPHWKSVLTRGICDYIASLTDQEAINEYERLYAGTMELI